jgi:hypothetical protein
MATAERSVHGHRPSIILGTCQVFDVTGPARRGARQTRPQVCAGRLAVRSTPACRSSAGDPQWGHCRCRRFQPAIATLIPNKPRSTGFRPHVEGRRLTLDVDQFGEDFVAGCDHPRIRLKGPLGRDHFDKLLGQVDIRHLDRTGTDAAER